MNINVNINKKKIIKYNPELWLLGLTLVLSIARVFSESVAYDFYLIFFMHVEANLDLWLFTEGFAFILTRMSI